MRYALLDHTHNEIPF